MGGAPPARLPGPGAPIFCEDCADGACGWPFELRLLLAEPSKNLAGAPVRVSASSLQHGFHDHAIEPCRMRKWRPGFISKPCWPFILVSRHPLIGRFSAHAELQTEVGHRPFPLHVLADQKHPFVHSRSLPPAHQLSFCRADIHLTAAL